VQQSSLSTSDIIKRSVKLNLESSAVTNKPKINVGLTAARPKWLAAAETAIINTKVEMASAINKVDAVEKTLRTDNEDIAAKYTAMRENYSKYRSCMADTEAYKAALLKEQECTRSIAEITKDIASAGTEGGSRAEALQKKLAAGYDALAAASLQATAAEDQIRVGNPRVAQAYAEMVASRKIYRASLRGDEGYNSAKSEYNKVLLRYNNLIKRRNKLKKEIGNE
jgi:seryl-tRNA synthetase